MHSGGNSASVDAADHHPEGSRQPAAAGGGLQLPAEVARFQAFAKQARLLDRKPMAVRERKSEVVAVERLDNPRFTHGGTVDKETSKTQAWFS